MNTPQLPEDFMFALMQKIRKATDSHHPAQGIQSRKRESGFTLVELLVVLLIIGILTAIAIPAYQSQRDRAVEASVQSDLRNFYTVAMGAIDEESFFGEIAETFRKNEDAYNYRGSNFSLCFNEDTSDFGVFVRANTGTRFSISTREPLTEYVGGTHHNSICTRLVGEDYTLASWGYNRSNSGSGWARVSHRHPDNQ